MESVARVRNSLKTPIRKLTSCVLGVRERTLCAKPKRRSGRVAGGRGGRSRSGRTPPRRTTYPKDPSVIRSYQADLEKERKLREATNAQKNAQRAAMRAHFRRKYQLSESPKDINHLSSVGGNVSLPHELSKIIHPEDKSKDGSFNLLRSFQGLGFGTSALTGRKHGKTSTPTPAGNSNHRDEGRHIAGRDRWIMRSVHIQVNACTRAQGACGPRYQLCGVPPRRALCLTTAGGTLEGGKSEAAGVRKTGVDGGVRSFEEIPHTGRNGWVNLVKFWREDRFRHLHKHMERTFNTLGPIYREHVGTHSSVNIMMPSDIAELFRSEGLHPRRMTLQPWATHRETRQHSKGVFLKNGEEWRADRLLLNKEVMATAAVRRFLPLLDEVARDFCQMLRVKMAREGRGKERKHSLTIDPSPDLFRFALEASCHVIYGERIGLFSSSPSLESQKFIWAVERMLATTPPLLYLPTRLLLRVGAPLWIQHASAWDYIFSHAEERIQRGYHRLASGKGRGSEAEPDGGQYTGVLGQLMEKGQLSLDLIKANITELMAGGVDTTAVPLQFALFELGRNPEVQEKVRKQARASWAQAGGDPQKALQGAPLLKGTVKETLRLYPVGTTVQRYPIRDIVLQNYHIPAGTMVQACLYPLGRSAEVFEDPKHFDPGRWCSSREDGPRGDGAGFRSLAFGFGARQCVGRRIAENEMQLLLMHILLSFHLTVSSSEDIRTTCTLILQPETPPRITFSQL
ncbi:cytochrome P450 11C1 [Brachionichthys hirsutus]|uniref:cytochrome P450 11C1 n=1 Tax=Brachionichthys hirsutus TaxID=412623 RepID=UPI0036043C2A